MAATRAETQQNDANSERVSPEQHSDSRNTLLQNGTDKTVGRAMSSDSGMNTKAKSPMATEMGQYRPEGAAPGHGDMHGDRGPDRGPQDPQYGQYRGYPDNSDVYGNYAPRPEFPGKMPRSPHGAQPQRFLSGQSISQPTGPTPTLNSLLQSGGGPPHRYPNSYEQPAGPYAQSWGPPRPMAPYSPQPYRNPSPSGGGARTGAQSFGSVGGYPPTQGGAPVPYAPYPQQQRYPSPTVSPSQAPPPTLRPPYSPHQYEQGPSPQASPGPGGAPHSPGHAPSASPQPPHSPHTHQPYPPRPGQPSTPNAHDPESELTGQNSNDSSSGGGGGGASGPRDTLVRPSPSPTGSSGSRSMSPAVGQPNIPMPPRPSSSQSESGGPAGGGASRPPHQAQPQSPQQPSAAAPAPAQPNYQHPPQPAHPYKMPPHHQNYPPPQHQYPQGNYSPRPPYPNQGYGGGGGGPGPAAGGQYGGPGRPQPQAYPPYGGAGAGTGPPAWGGGAARAPPPPPPPHSPHYLKQHLQHKAGPHQQQQHMGPPPPHHVMGPPGDPQDNGIPGNPPPPATALVTTGPDGAPLDDGSQQSTLSNASAASGEESGCGSVRVSRGGGAPSPGAASHASAHDDYDATSSSWPRTPSSPVFNSHVPQETYRTKKSDSLGKLYDMDEAPERRGWVERLLSFMEERRTPIAACPTISKQPLDLYRLYLLVRERGGFVEVTKNKTWKDIAGMLGIGASSSAAYTLRKHYTKNLLAYECHFDRGGIDPQPIINQVEATTKKKSNKNNSVPSPAVLAGSSNSQDSFQGVGGGGGGNAGPPNMDGYPPYPAYPPPGQPPQGYPGQQGYGGYDQYGSPYPANRPVYPPYGPEQDNRGYPGGGGGPGGDPYGRYPSGSGPAAGNYGTARSGSGGGSAGGTYAGSPAGGTTGAGATAGVAGPAGQLPPAPPHSPTPPPQGDYYRPPQPGAPPLPHLQHQQHELSSVNMNSQLARQLVAPLSPGPAKQSPYLHGYGGSKAMPPPAGQPRRHPDFAKDQPPQPPYPPRPQPPPHHQYGAWSNNSSGGQYRSQFPGGGGVTGGTGAGGAATATGSSGGPGGATVGATPGAGGNAGVGTATGQWGAGAPPRPPIATPNAQPWGPQPYPQQGQQPQPQPQGWGGAAGGVRPGAPPRPGGPYRPDLKQFPMQPTHQPPKVGSVPAAGGAAPKREITFPPDSVEAVAPVAYKRRRITKADVAPVEAWRLMMALKSGLLAETCWALDLLNVLLFDDASVGYFGLQHLPGLLDLLLEHFQKSLKDVFDPPGQDASTDTRRPAASKPGPADRSEADPGRTVFLTEGENYTDESRKGRPVVLRAKEDDPFGPDDAEEWDVEPEHGEAGIEPWQFGSDASSVAHVMPCFRGEFVDIPFARTLETAERPPPETEREAAQEAVPPRATCSPEPARKSNRVSEKKNKRTKTTPPEIANGAEDAPAVPADGKVNGAAVDPEEEGEAGAALRLNGPADAGSEDNFKSEPMEIERDERATERPAERAPDLKVNDPSGTLKRRPLSEYEDECYSRDEASLCLVTETQDSLARRCVCLSNILRNLTFVPGNETEFSKSGTFLALMGKLLLLHHEHPARAPRTRNYDREEDSEWKSSCSSLQTQEWWWDFLAQLREDALVCCANIGGQVDLGRHPEQVARPVLDGLLHWAVCPSAAAQDPLPALPPHRALSPRRLALEALCKLCVTDANVDLVVATPPFPRLERLCSVLAKHLCRSEDQVLREFSVNLLHYLAAADSAMARTIAARNPTVSLLVAFIEQAEQSALGVANQHGICALRDNPDSMGTSLDMLRRAAGTLLHLARHPDNKPLFLQQEQRLLSLVMSQILDQKVAAELSKVLFQCSRHPRHPNRSD